MGDIESMPFIEAFRQFQFKVKKENFCNIHVSLVPQVRHSDFTLWGCEGERRRWFSFLIYFRCVRVQGIKTIFVNLKLS